MVKKATRRMRNSSLNLIGVSHHFVRVRVSRVEAMVQRDLVRRIVVESFGYKV